MSHAGHDTGSDTPVAAISGHATMVPYFHFTPGDHLYFKGWVPKSAGAIAGACIGLFLLAIFERWVTAMRAVFEHHWKQRALLLSARYSNASKELSPLRQTLSSEKLSRRQSGGETVSIEDGPTSRIPPLIPTLRLRTIPPFVPGHDIPRGILHAFQSLLGFLLMLATMTFRVEFILCICFGLGVGEAIFGRLSNGTVH